MTRADESGEVRVVRSPHLNEADLENLDGAPVFDGVGLDGCIIAVTETPEGFVAVYDYDLLWAAIAASSADDAGEEQMAAEEAMEYVDFNIVRAIPYMRPRAPIIGSALGLNLDRAELLEEYGDDVETFVVRGVTYVKL